MIDFPQSLSEMGKVSQREPFLCETLWIEMLIIRVRDRGRVALDDSHSASLSGGQADVLCGVKETQELTHTEGGSGTPS
jgi:hypothetical protein